MSSVLDVCGPINGSRRVAKYLAEIVRCGANGIYDRSSLFREFLVDMCSSDGNLESIEEYLIRVFIFLFWLNHVLVFSSVFLISRVELLWSYSY